MAAITFIGLEESEQNYFKNALTNHTLYLISADQPVPQDTEVLSVFVNFDVHAELVDNLPKLRLVACRSTGYDNVDATVSKRNNISIANVPSYGSTSVAEFTFLLLLAITRKLKPTLEESTAQHANRAHERGTDLAGKTLGVIGTGSIGASVARIAKAFGVKLIAFDPFPRKELSEIGCEYTSLEDLLKRSDIVTLHAPSTKNTHHIINKASLALMKPHAIIVNTARGDLIDTIALAEALHTGHLRGAALDVVEVESQVESNQSTALAKAFDLLHEHPDVILTNHNAYNSQEAVGKINQITLSNIQGFLAGRPENIVS